MTNTQKFDANEKKYELMELYGYRCQACGIHFLSDKLQLAHRINKGIAAEKFIERYLFTRGFKLNYTDIIHHPFNLAVSCMRCNDYFNIFYNPVQTEKLLNKIIKDLTT